MNKRYVQMTLKKTGVTQRFPTITKMYQKYSEETLGVTRNSLWNSLAKNNGVYENTKVRIEYRNTKIRIWK